MNSMPLLLYGHIVYMYVSLLYEINSIIIIIIIYIYKCSDTITI